MSKKSWWYITSRAGVDLDAYRGCDEEEAVRAMIEDGCGEYGSESAGTAADYIVERVPESSMCNHCGDHPRRPGWTLCTPDLTGIYDPHQIPAVPPQHLRA